MAKLPGQHCDLAAMVGVVGDQVADESSDVGTKSFDTTVSL